MPPHPACLGLTVHVNQGLFVNWQYISAKIYNSYLKVSTPLAAFLI